VVVKRRLCIAASTHDVSAMAESGALGKIGKADKSG